MKNQTKRTLALALSLVMLLFCFAGCSSQGKTLMQLEDHTISINMFQLFLSRMKGNLASSYAFGTQALTDSFWDTVMSTDGTTYNQHYTNQVLESTKTYLAALYAFDQRGLELPDSYIEEIDAELERLIEEDAEGSKSQFNAMLAEYGVNYKILREAYILEAKIAYLNDTMYSTYGSLIADNLVEDYYQQTYARFKQVFLYTYDYVYYTDGDGEAIYYTSDGKIAYDTSATAKMDGETPVLDENGEQVYMNEDGKIAYDKTNGTRKHKTAEDGSQLVADLTGSKLQQVIDQKNQIEAKVVEGDFNGFDALVEQYSLDTGMETYPNGYYLTAATDYDSPEVVEALFELEVGETATVQSQYGFHIIMRYEAEAGAYDKEEYSDFFISTTTGTYVFVNDLKNQLLAKYLEPFKEQIVIDQAVLSEADIKRIGANMYY